MKKNRERISRDCSTCQTILDESLGSVLWFGVTWRWMLMLMGKVQGLQQLILWLAAVLINFVLDGAMGLADELEAELIRSGTQKGLGAHGWQSSINAS
ncbi:unnamed protein product, partial [Mesorhabditis belari]|uniref:Uncharacterized protein n=1 Tax=Mesorhabditis belari TaxID=2138241 RepID=A0AAF3F8H1_9BILA